MGIATCATGLVIGTSLAHGPDTDSEASTAPGPRAAEPKPAGQHWRIDTARGPVHVWMPTGYRHESAGVVVYVHGYYTDVDGAFADHRLAEQFARSGRNALFIVPEAPGHSWHEVRWEDVGELIRTVRKELGLLRPWGPVIAMGHSGAYRTLMTWLDYPPLEHVIVLDGLYAHEEPFTEWLEQPGKAVPNRLTLVSIDTLRWSEPWARELGLAHTLDWIPDDIGDLDDKALGARLLYIRSQYDHMDMVTRGKVIPLLLQATRLPALDMDSP